ncbi:MAG: hypothetical protein IKD21_03365 [Clostridia bacterium]|nr:hypothetical protein [Clostridia bacterium]
MEMKYYNPSNNFRAPIPRVKREPKPYIPPPEAEKPDTQQLKTSVFEEMQTEPEIQPKPLAKREKTDVFGKLSQDDMIILGIIFLLLLNSCDDYLLLLVLGYLFISGRESIV